MENTGYAESTSENNGVVKISENVIATLATIAASEVDGVYAVSLKPVIKKNPLLKKGVVVGKGVKVSTSDEKINVDIYIIIKYGFNVNDTATEVQESVFKAITSMTGLEVGMVNVHVTSVEIEKR